MRGDALVPAIRADIEKPRRRRSCDYIQIEEPLTPSHATEDRTLENLVETTINAVVDGITELHVHRAHLLRLVSCGTAAYAKRTYRWLFPALLDANVHGFNLEFGAREMAEIDLVGKWDRDRILSMPALSISRRTTPETADDIIRRVRTCLEYRDPERLEISTDCGLRRVPPYLAISKMSAAAEERTSCGSAAESVSFMFLITEHDISRPLTAPKRAITLFPITFVKPGGFA